MRVLVVPADEHACGFYRLIWPAIALQQEGFDVSIVVPSDPMEDQLEAKIAVIHGEERLLSVKRPDADVVVLQRPLKRVMLDAIPRLQDAGIKVVIEIDDDFSSIDPRNSAFWACQPSHGKYVYPDGTEKLTGGPNRNWHNIAESCRLADLVTVTTPALARRYGAHGRVRILPNRVPESYLKIEGVGHDGVVVGWAGSVHSHPTDLKVVGAGVQAALVTSGAQFSVVGSGEQVDVGLHLKEPPQATGYISLWEYPYAVANFDIGLAPLVDSAFNRAKSGLKALEYASLGVAAVASPTPDNVRLEQAGLCMVADKPKDWQRAITRLATNDELRHEWVNTARARAALHTVEANADRWWDAWTAPLTSRCRPSRSGSG